MVEKRAHPTLRPRSLALGVVAAALLEEQPGAASCPPLPPASAALLAQALLRDVLAGLMTFPVRHRFAFGLPAHGGAAALEGYVSEAWKCEDFQGSTPVEQHRLALDLLLSTGAEAALLVRGDVAGLPLGELFDALIWLLPRRRLVVGRADGGGLYAVGVADNLEALLPAALERSAAELEAEAAKLGVPTLELSGAFPVTGEGALRRLGREVTSSPHLGACRDLFARPEFAPYLPEEAGPPGSS